MHRRQPASDSNNDRWTTVTIGLSEDILSGQQRADSRRFVQGKRCGQLWLLDVDNSRDQISVER